MPNDNKLYPEFYDESRIRVCTIRAQHADSQTVCIELHGAAVRRLDALAAATNCSRDAVIRRLIYDEFSRLQDLDPAKYS